VTTVGTRRHLFEERRKEGVLKKQTKSFCFKRFLSGKESQPCSWMSAIGIPMLFLFRNGRTLPDAESIVYF
jgi:hypothetical protein